MIYPKYFGYIHFHDSQEPLLACLSRKYALKVYSLRGRGLLAVLANGSPAAPLAALAVIVGVNS